jgi:YfiH family protein
VRWIEPDWPAPPGVRAVSTTRLGGVSAGPFRSLNLGDHVGDDPRAVTCNRERLRAALELPEEPRWLAQVHGCDVADAGRDPPGCRADASAAFEAGRVCAVLTADCLPLLMTDRAGTRVAAVHAGWRGLAHGVVEAAVARLAVAPGELLCWLGPAIGPEAFEVGDEVRECFLRTQGDAATEAFRPTPEGTWLADLYALARLRLADAGVASVHGGGLCTYGDGERFFSYRRDGVTGRMASLVWIEEAG